jgi:hypothetical protein
MILGSADGSEFELRVLRYAYPGEKWLDIYTRATTGRGSWEGTDPSLEASEVRRLSKWLSAHAAGRTRRRELEFTEPNLRFEMVHGPGEGPTLRVYFELESRPPWAYSASAGQKDVWVDLQVSSLDLRSAAESLVSELNKTRRRRGNRP